MLVAWSVFIKYIFPIAFALFSGEPWNAWVLWDLWPVAHAWLGWALLTQPWYTRWLAVAISTIDIVIIVTLPTGFLVEPDWTIWRTNWFVNECFVLVVFVLILATVVYKLECFRARSQ